MATKKAGGGKVEAAAEGKTGRAPAGPYWHQARRQWVARLGGRTFYEKKTIGQADVEGARKWYRQVAKEAGVKLDEGLPGTPTEGSRRLAVTFTEEVAVALKELDPLVAAEHLSATSNYSRAISVAVTEALARRQKRSKG